MLKPDISDTSMLTKLEKLFFQGFKVLEGLHMDEDEAADGVALSPTGDRLVQSPKKRTQLIHSLRQEIELLKQQKIEVETQKLKLQFQIEGL